MDALRFWRAPPLASERAGTVHLSPIGAAQQFRWTRRAEDGKRTCRLLPEEPLQDWTSRVIVNPQIAPETLLRAYAMGVFPMAESRESPEIRWINPQRRGVISMDRFHVSRSLGRALVRPDHSVTTDTDFAGVVDGCANRDETWINAEIRALYVALHRAGLAHSIEVRDLSGALVGGVYGVTLGAAFFGESMFSRRSDASKIALAWCIDRLVAGGFMLFDTQFLTPHLASLGAEEISRAAYHRRLDAALRVKASWNPADYAPDAYSVRQRRTQTS